MFRLAFMVQRRTDGHPDGLVVSQVARRRGFVGVRERLRLVKGFWSLDMSSSSSAPYSAPGLQGLYDPAHEHDACGVGFVAHIKGKKSHRIIEQGSQILCNLDHRGAVGADPLMGDGAGMLKIGRAHV